MGKTPSFLGLYNKAGAHQERYTGSMLSPPPMPDVPATQRDSAASHLRYSDVAQDGRVMVSAFPYLVSPMLWGSLLSKHPLTPALRSQGILPILTRAILEGSDSTVSVFRPVTARGCFQLACTRDAEHQVERIVLDAWAELGGTSDRTYGPPPPDQGALVNIGRVFLEHVLTRPFAPPEARKVRSIAAPGMPEVPEMERTWRPPEELAVMPANAVPLEEGLGLDEAPIVFGLEHTDSNQHVNSLVYPRLFHEAALRRFARLGCGTRLLTRAAAIAFRKPCFAGEQMRIAVRAFTLGGQLGALGCFVPEEAARSATALASARPHCFAQMVFTE